MRCLTVFITTFLLAFLSAVQAELKLPYFFTDHAVLQQETGAQVWGWGHPGSDVVVKFAGQEKKTKVDGKGSWSVNFTELKASSVGQDLVIQSGKEKLTIHDVLVGEVWLASGQSNMEWKLEHTNSGKEEMKNARDPLLRVFTSSNTARAEPQKDWWGAWNTTEPGKSKNFTAVGYHFGKRLRAELNVPVGIIECAWGGKPAQSFISRKALEKLPEAQHLISHKAQLIAKWDPIKAKAAFEKKNTEFQTQLAEWKKTKKGKKPRKPRQPMNPAVDPGQHSTIYNGMIAPLVGYGARGVIWYQGESNANKWTAKDYQELLGCLVSDWRQRWQKDLSFYWVQLANYRRPSEKPGVQSDWVTVQDEMRRALKTIPRSGMVVANDVGAAFDIHPRNKRTIGERLARWALHHDYGRSEIVVSGPLFSKKEVKGAQIILHFDYAKGLKARDGKKLVRFEIAGADGKWNWAQAKIEGEKVIVWHDQLKEPKMARYAWADNPAGANLVNGEGLPASCFTTE